MNSSPARFITFEGIDGAGKSTHVEWFAEQLRERGHRVDVTREPGGTELAEALRDLLLHRSMTPATEVLLAFAARSDHLERRIRPALAEGRWVVCDRFTDSTYAYQGGGRGVSWTEIEQLERWVQRGLQPDLTLLFDVPAEVAAQRRAAARSADRFESEDQAFFGRVKAAYRRRVESDPSRFVLIDGTQSIEMIKKTLEQSLSSI
jgi:dTMP kinase